MKTWKYLSIFVGLMALCVVVGMAFFIYCDSGEEEKERFRQTITAKIEVNEETKKIELKLFLGETPLPGELIEADHTQKINWVCEQTEVVDFLLFFGPGHPVGKQNHAKFDEQMRPEDGERIIQTKVHYNPNWAGSKLVKYHIAVIYKPAGGTAKLIMRDPEIIIPPRGGSDYRDTK
jgi:hypothetical protein